MIITVDFSAALCECHESKFLENTELREALNHRTMALPADSNTPLRSWVKRAFVCPPWTM